MSSIASCVGDLARRVVVTSGRVPGWVALVVSVALGGVILSSCGGGGGSSGGGGGSNCTVTGVSATANPTSVALNAASTVSATVTASSSCSDAVTWSALPAGGTLTVSGGTATFTSGTAGTYTITATSSDDASKAGSASVVVMPAVAACGTPNGTVVTHASNISADETWAGGGVTHQVQNSIEITGAAVVTVQPCAIVAMGPGATITVIGTAKLLAAGTSSTSFVVFERADVNQAWGILRGASDTSMIELHWTVLQGAGAFGGEYNNPAIAAVGPGYFVPPAAVVKVDNVFIQSPQGTGVYLDANAAFTADSQALTISGATTYPVLVDMMALGSIPSGSYTGNAIDEINIVGPSANVFGDLTIHDRGVPVRIQTGGLSVAPSGNSTTPVTLTVEPGVTVKFPKANATTPGARVIFGTNGSVSNNLVGVLNAVGTADKPIVFTSGEANPAPGDWVGLWLDTATGSKLENVEISYAGAPSGIVSANCRPLNTPDNAALIIGDFEAQYVPPSDLITNSVVSNSAGFGIDAVWRASTYNGPDLTSGNTFLSNAMCAQTFNGPTTGVCPANGCTAN
ncbi:MAG TPA: hypothetical protein VMG60_10315 [Burkholderiaceae bacterium]|nr:hypothetical protein [Burkholderiaceae bacterium]